MRFLKKASYKDIIGENRENQFHHYDNISAKYKEFELFLTNHDLEDLLSDDYKLLNKLINILKKDGAVISAVHCPESAYNTCNEYYGELSENYLSLCEVVRDEESKKRFKNLLSLADYISSKQQNESENSKTKNNEENLDDEDEEGDENSEKKNKTNKESVIIILHEGCEKGCCKNDAGCKMCEECDDNAVLESINTIIKAVNLNYPIKVVLENVTPFYSARDVRISKGRNCGWKPENQKSSKAFFSKLNEKLKDSCVEFGSCIDFCHIMVSAVINGEIKDKASIIEEYFKQIDFNEYIYLFHVSNYDEDWSHGKLFAFDNNDDRKAIELIRKLCNEYAEKVPITFEMADGTDIEKASLNYEHIMFYFSKKHYFGRFNELLEHEKNKELKAFFDELFFIYSSDKKDVFEITNSMWYVKQTILKNTFIQDEHERLFGVDFDKTEVNLSLIRLKAYLYYTRFCNLGNYLAENYYNKDNSIWNNEEDILAEDFGLSMKYFMFNDKIHQCVYTGIMFRFLIDFLPKKESFFRFNDGITKTRELKLQKDEPIKNIVQKISEHISGTSISTNGIADFYSVGKNFPQCLFKYYNSNYSEWSLRFYKNTPVNFVEYSGRRYSIQAFIQLTISDSNFIKNDASIKLSLDISRFAAGRDGKETDSLEGFLNAIQDVSFSKERVASISDEEILFTELPGDFSEYLLSAEEGMVLKKMILKATEKRNKNEFNFKVSFNQGTKQMDDIMSNLQDKITDINNNNNNNVIWKILDEIQLYKIKNSSRELEELNVYLGNDKDLFEKYNDKDLFEKYKECIHVEIEEKKNGK